MISKQIFLFAFLFIFLLFTIYYLLFSFIPIFTTRLTTHNPSPPITIIAVGDIMLGRSVNAKMLTLSDFSYPFAKTSRFLKSADLTFGNLESPLVSDCPTTNTGMVFCADLRSINGLIGAGFDVLNLANNHIRNYGDSGVEETINLLNRNGVSTTGVSHYNNIYYYRDGGFEQKEIKGTKIGFLGFDLTSTYLTEKIISTIKEKKPKVDFLILSIHWGQEYAKKPTQAQVNLAHQIIDSGADLVLGHHPHVIQPTEEYKEKLIIYSMGNFVFDQSWSEETKKGLVSKLTFQDKKLIKTEFLPIYIRDLCQPEFINP